MPTAQKYNVEKQATTVQIVGECPIVDALAGGFADKNIQLVGVGVTTDYVICWDCAPLEATTSRQVIVHSFGTWSHPMASASGLRHIYLGSLYGAPLRESLLSDFLSEVSRTGQLSLPGDGVAKHYLLTTGDAIKGIVAATLHPRGRGEVYLLGRDYSLLSLAYHFRESFPGGVKVTFNGKNNYVEAAVDWDLVATGLEPLKLEAFESDDSLKQYLKWLIGAPSVVPSAFPPSTTPRMVHQTSETQNLPSSGNLSFPSSPNHEAPPQAARPKLQKFMPTVPTSTPNSQLPAPTPKRHLRKIEFEPIAVVKTPRKPGQKQKTSKGLAIFINLLAILGITTFLYLCSILISVLVLAQSLSSLRQSLTGTGNVAHTQLGRASAGYLSANSNVFALIPPLKEDMTAISRLAEGAGQVLALEGDLTALKLNAKTIVDVVLGTGEGKDILPSLNQSRLLVESVYNQLSILQGTLPKTFPKLIPVSFDTKYESSLVTLSQLKGDVLVGKAVLAILPDLVGVGERRQYALLLQNNMELRPTGGFIGSFALPSFDNGRLFDLPVYDVYQADGQLKGHVEPPLPIKKYLGEANWFLRDSNWDPDFPTTAGRVNWYIKKTLNQDVSGTIGINLSVIGKILDATGPLQVPEYDETITADNLYVRTQFHAEVGFFPGSTQKKEFLGSLVSALMVRLHSADTTTQLKIAQALLTAANNHDLTIAVTAPATQEVIRRLGWAGDLKSGSCPTDNCLASYLSVVDANVGVNKTNFYLKRNLSLDITFDKDFYATHKLAISQKNTAESSAWPAGSYKNYQRLYLPGDAELISLVRDGIPIAPRDIDTSIEHGKKVIGYLVTTGVGSSSEIVATYRLPGKIDVAAPNFSFYWQKQPGTSVDPLNITLNYPIYLTPTVISPAGDSIPQHLTFNLDNTTDRRVLVNFVAK